MLASVSFLPAKHTQRGKRVLPCSLGLSDTPGALWVWDQQGIDAHSGIVLQQNRVTSLLHPFVKLSPELSRI